MARIERMEQERFDHSNGGKIKRLASLDPYTKKEIEGTSAKLMSSFKSGASIPVNEFRNAVEESRTNGLTPGKEYRYIKNSSSLGYEILLGFAMKANNENFINKINSGQLLNTSNVDKVLSIESLKKTQENLYKAGVSSTREFKLTKYEDIKRMKDQMNVVSSRAGYGDITYYSDDRLDKLEKTIEKDISMLNDKISKIKSGEIQLKNKNGEILTSHIEIEKEINKLTQQVKRKTDTKNLIDTAKQMNGTNISKNIKSNKRNIKATVIRNLTEPISDTEAYKGYQTLRQSYSATRAIVKAEMAQFKGMYRLSKPVVKFAGRHAGRAGRYVLERAGAAAAHAIGQQRLMQIANSNISQTALNVAQKIPNAITKTTDITKSVINAPYKIKTNVRNSKVILSDRVRNVGKSRPVRIAKRAIKHSRIVRPVYGRALRIKRTFNRFGRTPIGRGAKAVGKGLGYIIKSPVKLTKFVARNILKLFNFIKGLIIKVLAGIVGLVAVSAVLVSVTAAIITTLTTIGDAVSNTYDNFITNTTMGATYQKLLDKETAYRLALDTVPTDIELPEEFIEKYGISEYTFTNPIIVDGEGNVTSDTSTIKGILSMAAIYIDQDFKKYGSAVDGVFADSVYKDYCAKLYDSTHLIGITNPKMDGSEIYYCNNHYADVALDNCNNKSKIIDRTGESGSLIILDEDNSIDWNDELNKFKRQYTTVLVCKERDDGTNADYPNSYVQTGPHGMSNTYDGTSSYDTQRERQEEYMTERGCNMFVEVQTGYRPDWETGTAPNITYHDGYEKYRLFCACQTCCGHVDANVVGFVSNIYDPSADTTDLSTDAYSKVEKTGVEKKFSMYALDKYATIFDEPSRYPIYRWCSESGCDYYYDYISETAPDQIEITEENPCCPGCGTNYALNVGRPGDSESCAEAASKENYAAEKYIMETILGEEVQLVNWWNNDGWFTKTVTTPTYFRLLTDGDIETASVNSSLEDKNVVNKLNSTPYSFESFTTQFERNNDFAKHGWDTESIDRVRLLMCADWTELYGITDFGGIGTGFTDAQIAFKFKNNEDWIDLCDDRKALMYTCIKFYSEIKRLNIHYHTGMCTASDLDILSKSNDPNTYFTKATFSADNLICPSNGYPCATQPGIDCSGFVSWIISRTIDGTGIGMKSSCQELNGLVGSTFTEIQGSDLLPGDIALKYNGRNNHVIMYIGSGKWAESAGHNDGVLFENERSEASLINSGYKFYKLSCIDETKFTVDNDSFLEEVFSNN